MITAAEEQTKYARMWERPEYRIWSPGLDLVPLFLAHVPWRRADRLVDLGCGTGRAGQEFRRLGFDVTLLDFCPDALEVYGPAFIEANLWALPAIPLRFDWVYCADVLEHLPTEHIDAALDGMASWTGRGGLLQICLSPDGCGALIGETLHLTVKPESWWMEKIGRRWKVAHTEDRGGNLIVILEEPK